MHHGNSSHTVPPEPRDECGPTSFRWTFNLRSCIPASPTVPTAAPGASILLQPAIDVASFVPRPTSTGDPNRMCEQVVPPYSHHETASTKREDACKSLAPTPQLELDLQPTAS
ncbi:unnamed protein product [Caenorhabditis brenneri]